MRRLRNMIDADDPRVAKIGHPAPPWLINYADLMTELVCFFIILYSLSAVLQKDVAETYKKAQKAIDEKKVQGKVEFVPEGMKVTLQDKAKEEKVEQGGINDRGNVDIRKASDENALFESGKAELTTYAKKSIDEIAPLLIDLKNEIVVEGHTDNVPIKTAQYVSNWELSTARATNVVKYLIEQKSFPPARLSAVGYGEYKPVEGNEMPEGKQKNRRVVFLVKNLPPDKVIGREGGAK